MSPMICKVLYFFLVVMPDFLHQQYVVLLYTHLQGGPKGVGALPRSLVLCFFQKSEWKKFREHLVSRELTYPTWGKGKSSSKSAFGMGYVSSLEGKLLMHRYDKFKGFQLKSALLARVGVLQ